MKKVRFGLVGAGGIARTYAQAFADCQTARLVAVADVRPGAARELADAAACDSYDSHAAMAARANLDAVVICTPPNTHPEISFHFLERGTHVLCEKPFSIDAASAFEMRERAACAGVTITMASKFRYVEDVSRAKELVTSGAIGEVVLFENAFTSRVDMSARWNSVRATSGGGVLIDNGTHSVDLMRYFLGPLAEVQVIEGKRSQGLAVEETVHIFARSTGGVMGTIDLSWSIDKESANFISIYGSEGTIEVGWRGSKYRRTGAAWVAFGDGYDKVQAFRNQLDNFSGSIMKDEPLLITADDACASVEVVEAAYASLRRSQWTTVSRTVKPARRSSPRRLDIARDGRVV